MGFFAPNFSSWGEGDLEVKKVPFIRTERQGCPLKDKEDKTNTVVTICPSVTDGHALKGLNRQNITHNMVLKKQPGGQFERRLLIWSTLISHLEFQFSHAIASFQKHSQHMN